MYMYTICIHCILPSIKSCVGFLLVHEGMSFSGREFDAMSPQEQKEACQHARLFSRVEPAHKSKIVEYLQQEGAVSAMVGDMGCM